MLLSLLVFLTERETVMHKEPPSPTFFYRGAADLQQKKRLLIVVTSRFCSKRVETGCFASNRSDFCHVPSQLFAPLRRFGL